MTQVAAVTGQAIADVLARQQQAHQVGPGAAAGEHAVGLVAEADARAGPVDQALFDQRPAGALVPGVQRRIERRHQHFSEQRRQHHRAVEVGDVAGVVEVHRVAQIELIQLAQRGTGVAQRALQIDSFEIGSQFLRKDAAERLLLALQTLLHQVQPLLQELAVVIVIAAGEQPVADGAGGEGHYGTGRGHAHSSGRARPRPGAGRFRGVGGFLSGGVAARKHLRGCRLIENYSQLRKGTGKTNQRGKTITGDRKKITAAPAAGAPWPAERSRCSPKCPGARRSPPG